MSCTSVALPAVISSDRIRAAKYDIPDTPPLGNIQSDQLEDIYQKWSRTELADSLNCHCSAVKCLGPNVLVKNSYYKDTDFKTRRSNI